jgi:hypothetical protein
MATNILRAVGRKLVLFHARFARLLGRPHTLVYVVQTANGQQTLRLK